jgi:hypothetical protein
MASETDKFIRFGERYTVEVSVADIRAKLKQFHDLELCTTTEARFLAFCKDTAIDNPGGVVAMYLKDHGIDF